jgi:hypothetical protein
MVHRCSLRRFPVQSLRLKLRSTHDRQRLIALLVDRLRQKRQVEAPRKPLPWDRPEEPSQQA